MLKPGFWRHKEFKDVFVEVLDSYKETHSVIWWNLGFTGEPWMVQSKRGQVSDIIQIKDPENWIDYSYTEIIALSKSRGQNK